MADLQADLKKYLTDRPDPNKLTVVGDYLKNADALVIVPETQKKALIVDPLANQYIMTTAIANGVTLTPEFKDDLKKFDNLYGEYQKHQKAEGKGIVSKVDFAKQVSETFKGLLNDVDPQRLDFANQRLEAANEPGHAVLTMNQYNRVSELFKMSKVDDGLSDKEFKELETLLKKENPNSKLVSGEEGKKIQERLDKEKIEKDDKPSKTEKRKTSYNEDKTSDLGAELAKMIKEGHSPEALASKGADLSQELAKNAGKGSASAFTLSNAVSRDSGMAMNV